MRYAIISDIHGNLEALEAALESLSRQDIDTYLCGGDIVGYGADPSECIVRTKSLNPVTVRGNHDAACSGLIDTLNFNDAAREAITWTRNELNDKDKDFLRRLDLIYKNKHLILVHGTLHDPEAFNYMLDRDSALRTIELMDRAVCFIGHSHTPGIFAYKKGSLDYFYKLRFKPSEGEKVIVNVGSVGQPRDGDPRLCYAIYDTDENLIELKRLPYNIQKAQEKILKAALPGFLAQRLRDGI